MPAAKVFDSRVYDGEVFIESYLNQDLPRVEVTGKASGDLKDLQRLFLESELKESLGHVVEDWVLHGEQFTDLNIDIPLLDSPGQEPSKIEIIGKRPNAPGIVPVKIATTPTRTAYGICVLTCSI